MAVDPLTGKYAGWSPDNFVMNSPLVFIDPDGEVVIAVNEDARRNILNTLQPEDRNCVKF